MLPVAFEWPTPRADAGVRQVDLLPALRKELSIHKVQTRFGGPDDFVFPTERGARQDRKQRGGGRVVIRSVERANEKLDGAWAQPAAGRNHAALAAPHFHLASARYRRGGSLCVRQVGHSDPKVTLSIDAQVMYRGKGERERLKKGRIGHCWALAMLLRPLSQASS